MMHEHKLYVSHESEQSSVLAHLVYYENIDNILM